MTKTEELQRHLEEGWKTARDLECVFGWNNTRLRGTISLLATKKGLNVQRQRVNGVTSYRILQSENEQA